MNSSKSSVQPIDMILYIQRLWCTSFTTPLPPYQCAATPSIVQLVQASTKASNQAVPMGGPPLVMAGLINFVLDCASGWTYCIQTICNLCMRQPQQYTCDWVAYGLLLPPETSWPSRSTTSTSVGDLWETEFWVITCPGLSGSLKPSITGGFTVWTTDASCSIPPLPHCVTQYGNSVLRGGFSTPQFYVVEMRESALFARREAHTHIEKCHFRGHEYIGVESWICDHYTLPFRTNWKPYSYCRRYQQQSQGDILIQIIHVLWGPSQASLSCEDWQHTTQGNNEQSEYRRHTGSVYWDVTSRHKCTRFYTCQLKRERIPL